MRQTLRLHPASFSLAPRQIEVEVKRPQVHRLALAYIVIGKINDLIMPPVAAPAPADELWRHTCFEAFIRSSAGVAYYEFNFAPSTQWAAYRFGSYRSGRRFAAELSAPRIEVDLNPERYILQTSLKLNELLLPASGEVGERGGGGATWRLALSAIIEEASGRQSYWALAHPPGKPDFHHSDCFALEVPAPQQP
jgi:hypothetical protein